MPNGESGALDKVASMLLEYHGLEERLKAFITPR
jgi:hypothetical protein